MTHDARLDPVGWRPELERRVQVRVTVLMIVNLVFATWYFGWLARPDRVGNIGLYLALGAAELFNLVQAVGFWWTITARRKQSAPPPWTAAEADVEVDVLIPVYNEPLDVVEATIVAASRLPGAQVRVAVLDDGNRAALARLAERHGARYVRRGFNTGA